jgi:hypothetical protein
MRWLRYATTSPRISRYASSATSRDHSSGTSKLRRRRCATDSRGSVITTRQISAVASATGKSARPVIARTWRTSVRYISRETSANSAAVVGK